VFISQGGFPPKKLDRSLALLGASLHITLVIKCNKKVSSSGNNADDSDDDASIKE